LAQSFQGGQESKAANLSRESAWQLAQAAELAKVDVKKPLKPTAVSTENHPDQSGQGNGRN
jgi:hypothetical protein